MDEKKEKRSHGGSGFFEIQIVFIALKWAGAIDWSWWHVFMPTWIACFIIGPFLVIGAMFVVMTWMFEIGLYFERRSQERKKRRGAA